MSRARITCASGSGFWVCQAAECGPSCAHELPPNAQATGLWHFPPAARGIDFDAVAKPSPPGKPAFKAFCEHPTDGAAA
jgi:hypothetical protein